MLVKPRITKEEFCNEIKRIYFKVGKMNTVVLKKYCQLNLANVDYYCTKFGGIKNICKELNIPFTHALRIDDELVIKDFIKVYKKNNNKISKEIYEKHGSYSSNTIRLHFGGYNNLMKYLGIDVNISRMDSKKDIVKDFLSFYNKYETTSSNLYRRYGKYSQSVIERVFGSWENMMRELDMPYIGQSYGKDYIVSELKRVYNKYGFISREVIDNECAFTYQATSFYFKSKDEISEAIGVNDAYLPRFSVNNRIIDDYLKDRFGSNNYQAEKTWDWLRNDKTKRNMYVDFYVSPINTAIEYDGRQHFEYVSMFHSDTKDLTEQQYRDSLKNKLLNEHNINIVRFNYKDTITPEFLTQILG